MATVLMKYDIQLKNLYTAADDLDGARVLVDGLWPRGKKREELFLTEWYRDAAPSNTLRRGWHNNVINADLFFDKYREELQQKPDCLFPLLRRAREGRLTLLSASKTLEQSHLPVLKEIIESALEHEDILDRQDEPSSPTCFAKPEDF